MSRKSFAERSPLMTQVSVANLNKFNIKQREENKNKTTSLDHDLKSSRKKKVRSKTEQWFDSIVR